MTERGLAVVIAGPSGVGKGAVHERVRGELPDSTLAISVTTRPARSHEVDGVDYVFVDEREFDRLVAEGAFIEHATYAGHHYGTPRDQVERAVGEGGVVILDIEVQGALQIRSVVDDALLVFLLPPSIEELERRLRARGTEDEASLRRRLERAKEEIAEQYAFDVQVVNDDLDRCVEEVVAAIQAARAA